MIYVREAPPNPGTWGIAEGGAEQQKYPSQAPQQLIFMNPAIMNPCMNPLRIHV
jgi:hypothetical protein